jgi:hypothetical protein
MGKGTTMRTFTDSAGPLLSPLLQRVDHSGQRHELMRVRARQALVVHTYTTNCFKDPD